MAAWNLKMSFAGIETAFSQYMGPTLVLHLGANQLLCIDLPMNLTDFGLFVYCHQTLYGCAYNIQSS